jgi:hypothetical protein
VPLLVAVLTGLLLGPAGPAAAADLPGNGSWTAVVNDVNVDRADGDRTVRLVPGERARVTVVVENRSDEPVSVPYVRLEGSVLGLAFYVYTTRVDLEVPAGGDEELSYEIDLLDLGDQARGLIPSRLVLLDDAGEDVAAISFPVDVRGQFTSVYGVFGMAVAAVTLLLLAGALWRLATGGLHPNRWRRGLTMAAPGLGLGFVLTFTLSVLGIATPKATLWAVLLLAGAGVGFAAGYLSPTPGDVDEAEKDGDGLPNFAVDPGDTTAPVPRAATDDPAHPLSGR